MKDIPSDIKKRLHTTLLSCRQFDSDQQLKTVFVDPRISMWRDDLYTSPSREARAENVVALLHGKYDFNKNNGLILFLKALSDSVSEFDACHQELVDISNELERYENQDLSNDLAKNVKTRAVSSLNDVWKTVCAGGRIELISSSYELLKRYSNHFSTSSEPEKYEDKLQPSNIVSFSISKGQLERIITRYLSEKQYVSRDIFSVACDWNAYPLYLPFFIFKGNYKFYWKSKSTTNAGEQHQKTHRMFFYLEIASKHNLTENEISFLEFDMFKEYGRECHSVLQRQEALSEKHLKGYILEPFALLSRSIYEHEVIEKIKKRAIEDAGIAAVAKDYEKSLDDKLELVAQVFLPYWVVSYNYDGIVYLLLVDGCHPAWAYGETPKDTKLDEEIDKITKEQESTIGPRLALAAVVWSVIFLVVGQLIELPLGCFISIVIVWIFCIAYYFSISQSVRSRLMEESISYRKEDSESMIEISIFDKQCEL